jgi:hypothetical protein
VPDIESRLGDLATGIEWPPTPRLAGRVVHLLPARRGFGLTHAWMVTLKPRGWAVAAAVLAVLAAAIAYSPSRDALAGWLNLHAIIERIQQVPSPSPQPPGPLGTRLGLGSSTTLRKAEESLAWKVAVPSSLGTPDQVYLQEPPASPPQGEVTLVYSARPGIPVASQTGVAILITEARGAVDTNLFGKMLGQSATLDEVDISGHQGYWITGQPNVFFFIDANGVMRNETMRLAANTLIFDDNGTIVRIEGNLTKAQAVGIAAAL